MCPIYMFEHTPNQAKEQAKNIRHIIKKDIIRDFISEYIPKNCVH